MNLRKACFLDRDGVLIEERNYLSDPGKAVLCLGAADAIKLLRAAGYAIVVTSNQSGVARGLFSMKAVEAVKMRIEKLLAKEDASVDAWYHCPHHPEGKVPELSIDCECRKPKPGMLLQAAKDLNLDLPSSFMIGDKLSDLEAAFSAGCLRAALVRTGHGTEQALPEAWSGRALAAASILPAAKELLATAARPS